MTCLIKNGKYYTEDGQESLLYKDLIEKFSEAEANKLFLLSHTDTFKDSVKSLPSKSFYKNGEIKVNEIIRYVDNNFSNTEPLTEDEVLQLSTINNSDIETSEDLLDLLTEIFYKDGYFNPDVKKMKKLYSEAEIVEILESADLQSQIKDTVERLRHTEIFDIYENKVDKDYSYKSIEKNIIGQGILNNPHIERQESETEGMEALIEVDEEGKEVYDKLIYDNAVKEVKEPKIFDAVIAVINAPETVDTSKVENKVSKWLLDYGIDVKNLDRDDYPTLLNYLQDQTNEDATIALEEALGFKRSPKKQLIKKEQEPNKNLVYLRTTKTEQQLFDELSLIKTNTPNVYHKVNKVEEETVREAINNQDLTIPEYELYKEYYGYGQLNLKNKESRVKYYNNLGWNVKNEDNIIFRSGNLITKAEDTYTMRGNRGSGHFGTGFYFFGDIQRADEYDKRGVSILNTEGYNLIRIKNYENGLDLHQALKEVNNFYYQNNLEAIAFEVRDTFELPFFEFKNKLNFEKLDNYLLNNQEVIDYLTDKISKNDVNVFDNNRELTNEILTIYKNEYENKANILYKSLEKTVGKLQNSLSRLGITTDKTNLIKRVQNYNLDEYSETSKGKDTLGTEIIKDLGYEGIFVKGLPELDNSLYGNVIFDIKDNTSISTDSSKIEQLNTNIETDVDYLQNEFVADFAAEKLKNPNSEFYQQFKITDAGIELISNDELTLAKVKSTIKNHPQLQDYSLISKNLPNLKEAKTDKVDLKDDRRIQAVNNKESIPSPKTEVEILDDQFIKAPNETAEWIRIGESIYEMQEESIYSKLNFQENPNYYTFNIEAPAYRIFEQKIVKETEIKTKKLIDKETDQDNFGCL